MSLHDFGVYVCVRVQNVVELLTLVELRLSTDSVQVSPICVC